MAKVILTNPTSGKIGSTVYSHNKGGAYTKALRIPTNPRTPAQMKARSHLASAAKQFRLVSPGTQAAWNDFAANNPIPDRMGQMVLISGAAWFTRAYANCLAAGSTTPPTEVWDPSVISPQPFSVSDPSAAGVEITLDNGAAGANAPILLRAFMSNSAGVNSPARFRQIRVLSNADTDTIDITADLKAVFGSLVASGNSLWLETVQVSTVSGSASSAFRSEMAVLTA